MIQGNIENINSPVRQIRGKVGLLGSSTITQSGETIRADDVTSFTSIDVNLESKNLLQVNQLTTPFNGEKPVIFSGSITGEFVINCSVNCEYTYETAALFEVIVDGVAKYVTPAAIKLQAVHCKFNGTITQIKIVDYCKCAEGSIDNIQLERGTTATAFTPYTDNGEVKVYGKNLITYPFTRSTTTINGVTFTDNGDGTITTDGTATANAIYYFGSYTSDPISLTKAVYTVSGSPVGAAYATYYIGIAGNNSGTAIEYASYNNGLSIELDTIRALYVVVKSGVTVDNLVFKPQLELGAAATDYVQYKAPTVYSVNASKLLVQPYCHTTTIFSPSGLVATANYTTTNKTTEYTYKDRLQTITIQRVPDETKFFGYGISQSVNVHLRDPNREINLTTSNGFKVFFAAGDDEYINNFPSFYITETHRNENTNELSITAYDPLYKATTHTVNEIELTSYTILQFAEAVAARMGLEVVLRGVEATGAFSRVYTNGANFEGTESLREALDDIAEATQTIYYVSGDNLVFRRLDKDAAAALSISKASYITLDSKENRRLSDITHATELGDNVSSSIGLSGSTQFVRDNAFWEKRDDIGTIVEEATASIGGLTIGQFTMLWRGNYLLELGDKIEITTKDNQTLTTYLLNDVIDYTGAFTQTTSWNYADNDTETFSNPTTIGDALKLTFARVDKQNKKIELIASDIAEQNNVISGLEVDLNGIKAYTEEEIEGVKKAASTYLTKDEYNVLIQEGIEGQNYKFTKDGLTFTDTNPTSKKEVETVINNKGMTVNGDGKEKLIANDEGVTAVDLTAKTFLVIGTNSRFEDYGSKYTACFWIGG